MDKKAEPHRKGPAGDEAARRTARQAEALRANLRRRKDQARARDDEPPKPNDKHD